MAKAGVRTAKTVLRDQTTVGRRKARLLPVEIKMSDTFVEIRPEGYGEKTAADGHGSPVVLEFHDGQLRLLVFADINDEEPTHVIPLCGALESERKDDAG